MSSNSDETYLEAFIESLATLPLEVRRNMELLHDLDVTCSSNLMLLQREQRQYIHQAEEKILQLEIVQMETEPEEATTATNDGLLSANNTNSYGVRIKGNDDDDSNNTNQHQNDNPVVVIPTTDELFAYTYQPDSYNRIRRLQQECLQYSEEKVSIAKQVYEQMEAQVERLDRDVKDMEQLLQAQGVSPTATLARPNDLAACQIEPGNEWILAKVLQHDPVAGSFKLADEDAESNKSKSLSGGRSFNRHNCYQHHSHGFLCHSL